LIPLSKMGTMNKNILMIGAAGAAAAVAAAVLFIRPAPATPPAYIDPADRAMVARGQAVYDKNCASCHGAGLEGQPDWRQRLPNGRLPAPPHDASGHTRHQPDQVLVDIVTYGLVPGKTAPDGYQSDMPAYGTTLDDADIVAVLAYIKSSWPAEALDAQRNITLQSK
jgi:mono/diheme cytochrome c family protein